MTYVYIASYQSIFLYLHVRTTRDKDAVAIVQTENMDRFLRHLGARVLWLPVAVAFPVGNPFELRRRISCLRTFVRKHGGGNKLFFCFTAFDILGLFLIAEWRRQGSPVYFHDLDPKRKTAPKRVIHLFHFSWWKHIYGKFLMSLLAGLHFLRILESHPFVLGIDQKFRLRYQIEPLDACSQNFMSERSAVIQQFRQDSKGAKVLWVADNIDGIRSFVNLESLARIFSAMRGRVAVKLHPRETQPAFYQTEAKLDDFVPAEFFFPSVSFVISISSAVLIQASYTSHIQAISLIDMVEWKNLVKQKELRAFITDAGRGERILFPRNLDELLKLTTNEVIGGISATSS